MKNSPTIIYTWTDEAPALATASLQPIIQAYLSTAGINVEARDISLSGRLLALFPERLWGEQRIEDALTRLGHRTQSPQANIIKLPNISASVPQLKAAIRELRDKGYNLPSYREEPESDADQRIKARYDRAKGSAVNPVLREGNSDRRAPKAVKAYARSNPHRMGKWSPDSKTHVATMTSGDFFHNERSVTVSEPMVVRIEHLSPDGTTKVCVERHSLLAGEIIDATVMQKKPLLAFLKAQVADALEQGVLFSLHMKATMMKVSDPIIFGHAVKVYFAPVFEKHGDALASVGVDVNNGLGDLVTKIQKLPKATQEAILADIKAACDAGPGLAMVDSDKGITNLHVPSDVIIDASMPAMIRNSGCMWNAAGEIQETKAVIPDSSYAAVYQVVIDDCKAHGAYDPTTMGSVSNVGLMAQKAEEYGSHDKTYEVGSNGRIRVVNDATDEVLLEHDVEAGDIWRMCQAKDEPIRDWVKLAVSRARESGTPVVFWLDSERAHDAELIKKVKACLPEHDTEGLEIHIMSPEEATRFSVTRIREGQDTISATGNVLRDYLTDLFPILEVGTSAKMLSIVPLMRGGGLFETGAGGSAPKHVQQFLKENHLRWDSLGEFLALGVSLEHLARVHNLPQAQILAETLDHATTQYLLNNKSPSRKVNEIDNRGSHFYLAMYWAQALAQCGDEVLERRFVPVAEALTANERQITDELIAVQGQPMDIGGYYKPDPLKLLRAMRPCKLFNEIVDGL